MPLTQRFAAVPRWLWLALLAFALMLPVILGPLRLNDSHWINYSWSEQFTAAIARGDLWPRWLPQSHGGLGAPDFYFYGPVSFWLAAPFGLIGLAPWPSLLCTATLALWLSGLAMARYCDGWTHHPALAGVLYMALPYHLLDFALRGALAEFVAYVTLPLIALGVRERRIGVIAFAYALLILTHLPTALLASLFLLPVLTTLHGGLDRATIGRIAIGLLLGLMLAAPYLLPALALQRFVSIEALSAAPALQASRWTILSSDARLRDGLLLIGLIAAAAALPAATLIRRDRLGWFVLLVLGLALGLIPAVWRLPLLARVQFPWRMLVLADFGSALLLARSAWPGERLLLLATPALALSLTILTLPTSSKGSAMPLAVLEAQHPDVIEYLPAGTTEPFAAYSHRALALARATPPASSANGWTTLHLHYFPIWHVDCGAIPAPVEAQRGTGLLRYRGQGCTLQRRRPLIEFVGITLAILAGLLLAALRVPRQVNRVR